MPRRPLLREGWPLVTMFAAYPLWWLLGFGPFIWPVVAVPMAVSLWMRRRLVVPMGVGIWILFLAWVVLSASQLDRGSLPAFVFRLSLYVSATVILLYVFAGPPDRRFDAFAGRMMVVFWIAVVVAGFAGLLLPHFTYRSLAEMVLPRGLLANSYLHDLVHPQFAQTMVFLGYPVPRPSALFTYTNEWGSAFALLTPLTIWGLPWLRSRIGRGTYVLLGAALIPALVSLNRGLWITLPAGLIYAAVRLAGSPVRRVAGRLLVFAVVAAVLVLASPLRGLVADRIATGHSNNARTNLYAEAFHRTVESPILGYGGPRPTETTKLWPDVGTQGQFWMVLFSHGFPGAALFVGWFVYAFARTFRPRSSLAFWCHVTLLIGLLQMPVYGLLPGQIQILMVAAALALREARPRGAQTIEIRPPESESMGVHPVETEFMEAVAR